MSKPFDASGKDLFEFAPAGWLGALGQPRPDDRVWMIDADLSATVTTATDKVIYVDDPEPWIATIELQANWDGDLPFDLLRRYANLRHRHRIPVSCAVILMRHEANSSGMTGNFLQLNPLGSPRGFPFTVFRVWEQPVELFLNGPLGLLPFAPIAQVRAQDVPRVKSIIEERLKVEASRSQRDILSAALVQLLALRYDEVEVAFWRDLMATLDISGTPLVKMWQAKAVLERAREDVLRLGRKKFASPPPPQSEAFLRSATDLSLFDEMMDRILDANNWAELVGVPEN